MPSYQTNKSLFVSPSTAKALSQYLIDFGVAPKSITAIIETPLDTLSQADFRLSIEQYIALWEYAINETQEPALGIKLGTEHDHDEMGLVGHIFFNNATIGDALKQYERYYSLVNEGMHIELHGIDDAMELRYVVDDERAYCIPDIEHSLVISMLRAKQNISEDLDIEYLGFAHPKPKYYEQYQKVFSCPMRFQQDHTKLVFKQHYLDYAIPKRSPYLHSVLTKHIEGLLKKFKPKPTLTVKVKRLVERKLSKDCVDANHIAEKLCMSRHTLYRRLKQEGNSFHDLIDQVREKKAMQYIQENNHSLSEIAFLLGFSELSAFSRAFKRWTGQSPAKYIKQMDL